MGAIISKLCCCTGRSTRSKFSSPPKPPPPKLSRNPSLIIERSVKFLRDAEEGSEYSRVLERDFEIKGKGKENKSLLRDEEITCKINSNTLKVNDNIIRSLPHFLLFRRSRLNTRKAANSSISPE